MKSKTIKTLWCHRVFDTTKYCMILILFVTSCAHFQDGGENYRNITELPKLIKNHMRLLIHIEHHADVQSSVVVERNNQRNDLIIKDLKETGYFKEIILTKELITNCTIDLCANLKYFELGHDKFLSPVGIKSCSNTLVCTQCMLKMIISQMLNK